MSTTLGVLNKKTGEVDGLIVPGTFEELEELIGDLMMNRVQFFEALGLLSVAKMRLYKRKLQLQDGVYNAYVDTLDFSDGANYWKSAFQASKIKDQLYTENEEYKSQAKELDQINSLSSCVDTTVDFVKGLERSTWGRYKFKEDE
jgi:hypothetical protein